MTRMDGGIYIDGITGKKRKRLLRALERLEKTGCAPVKGGRWHENRKSRESLALRLKLHIGDGEILKIVSDGKTS